MSEFHLRDVVDGMLKVQKPEWYLLDACSAVVGLAMAVSGKFPEQLHQKREVEAIWRRLKGNRPDGVPMSEADQRLMLESAYRRAIEIIDEAQIAQEGN